MMTKSRDNCIMQHGGSYGSCRAVAKEYVKKICGADCPFRKTMEEQTEIERKCYERLHKLYPKFVYISCIDGRPYVPPGTSF